MSNVYFKAITDYSNKELINDITYKMLKNIIKDENIRFSGEVPLKVHFGENGNTTFITPNNYNGIKRYLKENDIRTCYIETNVLYKGSRTLTSDHIKTAKEHGFDDLDIIIADGDNDNAYEEIEINKEFFSKCKIGYKYKNYKNYIVLSHFKGHGLAGFGGAIKQLGMGFASRGGKLNQHSDAVPYVTNKCISCGKCVDKCPVNAIVINDRASINSDKCIGCAFCSTICPVNAVSNNWQTSNFYEKLAEYAYAAAVGKRNIYVNFAFNITKECDCRGESMNAIAPDIGIFMSTDPVAVDTSTLDLLQEITGSEIFDNGRQTLVHAQKIGLGKMDYSIIKV